MGLFGSSPTKRQAAAEAASGQVYVERRPGESAEAFEARLAASARERAQPRFATGAARPAVVEKRVVEKRVVDRPRRRHGGSSFLGLLVVVIAAVGVLWMVLAAREGSFAAGGAVVDQKLAQVTSPARIAANEAVDRTGAAVQAAGQTLEAKGESLRETAK